MQRKIYDRHDLVRSDVKQVCPLQKCTLLASTLDLFVSAILVLLDFLLKLMRLLVRLQVAHVCVNCGVNMGEYFCEICKFYDDDIEKKQFHCDDCGICRIGGRENFFHCKKCGMGLHTAICIMTYLLVSVLANYAGSCYSISLSNNHLCVEDSMRHHCPICYEYLFDSLKDVTVMKCGHTMHSECYDELIKRDRFCCPICSKSIMDMSMAWKRIDEEIEATMMPEEYRYKKVWILCNDCNDTTEVYFHIIGQKCSHCESYNTRTIAPPVLPQ
ncbi:hypothetical protein SASPL_109229 [Salvia splendens]|uniref:RING finger and CHY zinc finger domain-containing protein 1 n=1 Tax=Salvia splendens TaxID=180675 RepID=A0A8X8YGR4_SALSN|nr:hypothetical protein SASPL_109229 [Salvia splendens]